MLVWVHSDISFLLALCKLYYYYYLLIFSCAQFETSDDPLDKITTAEAIRTLIESYRTSQYSYAATEKVNEISKVVSPYKQLPTY